MMMQRNLLICLLIIEIIYCQRLESGDICTVDSTGGPGVCKRINDCKKARDDLLLYKVFPQTCGFDRKLPIVCCEEAKPIRKPGLISKRRCREYAKYIYETKPSPILLIEAPDEVSDECGHKVVTLIIGGTPASRKEFPHSTAIGYELTPGDIQWLCGGTLISKKFVLTAAHCLNSTDFGLAKYVLIGVSHLADRGSKRQQYKIVQSIAHPKYKSSSHYHDIALLKLERPAVLNSYAIPACLYTEPKIEARQSIATGFGSTSYSGITNEELLKVTLNIYDNAYCNASYKDNISKKLSRGIVEDLQVCAGCDEEKDTCQGDSGGPLQIYHTKDDVKCMYDIIGVTSFGKACTGSPGVYVRVSNYIQWIEDIVWPEY